MINADMVATCERKEPYTRKRAIKVLQRMKERTYRPFLIVRPGYVLDIYQCPVCNHWHLGNRRKS